MTIRRKALRQPRVPMGQVSRPMNWRAPTGGWRADVPLADLPPDAAAQMVNMFPEMNYVRARYGTNNWAIGGTGPVQTLVPYSGSTNKLFAANGSSLYDVTVSSSVLSNPVITGLNSAYLSSAQITTAGGKFLQIVSNSALDSPYTYNGTSWSPSVWTGTDLSSNALVPAQLSVVALYRSRLYFIQKGTQTIWYGATDAITGTLTPLNLGDVLKFGGSLVAIGTWSIPILDNILQNIVFVTDQGEIAIYTGSDPSNPSNWSLLGTFKLGPPLGADRCLYQVGADLALAMAEGIVPISQAISLEPSASETVSMTKQILPSWLAEVQACGSTLGWQLITYPAHHMALVNVPDPQGTIQFVMNAESKAWCQFTGWPVAHFAIFNNQLMAGTTDGRVIQCETGGNDCGTPITGYLTGAFQRGADGTSQKSANIISMNGTLGVAAQAWMGVSVDYRISIPSSPVSSLALVQAQWGTAIWGQSVWPSSVTLLAHGDGSAMGVALAPSVKVVITGAYGNVTDCIIIGGSINYEQGVGL
jgi:hypothetical protein